VLTAACSRADGRDSLEKADRAMLIVDLSQARRSAAAIAKANPQTAAAFLLVGRFETFAERVANCLTAAEFDRKRKLMPTKPYDTLRKHPKQ
jgi:hypothetical protein